MQKQTFNFSISDEFKMKILENIFKIINGEGYISCKLFPDKKVKETIDGKPILFKDFGGIYRKGSEVVFLRNGFSS